MLGRMLRYCSDSITLTVKARALEGARCNGGECLNSEEGVPDKTEATVGGGREGRCICCQCTGEHVPG